MSPSCDLVEGAFDYEIRTAAVLHDGLNVADIAHLVLREPRVVVPDADAVALGGVLRDADATPWAEFGYDPAHGEVYSCRERVFGAVRATRAGWLHAGRPRREARADRLRLRVRRDVCRARRGGRRVRRRALARVADAHAEDPDGRPDLPPARPAVDVRALPDSLARTRCCATSTG